MAISLVKFDFLILRGSLALMSNHQFNPSAHPARSGEPQAPKLDGEVSPAKECAELRPSSILQLGLGFWGSKTLLSAVELGVFTELAKGSLEGEALRARLGLHQRSSRDFFDALVALGMLQREQDRYGNTPESDLFLDRAKKSYIGGVLEMANARLFKHWANLTSSLRSGEPQGEASHSDGTFAELYADPARLKQFLSAMTGISRRWPSFFPGKTLKPSWYRRSTRLRVRPACAGSPAPGRW